MNDVRDNDTMKPQWEFFSRTDTILSMRAFSQDGHKMFLPRDYPLVVVAQKFDVHNTNIRFVKFSRGNYQPLNTVPREKHITVFTVQH